MKKRDVILVGLPFAGVLLLAMLAMLLHWQIARFEGQCRLEAQENVAQETKVVADVLGAMLERGDMPGATSYCGSFSENTLRLTLMDDSGKVLADSRENSAFMGNHLNRKEIQEAIAGHPNTVIRYSESLGKWMIYHAVAIRSASGNYILRVAVSTDRVNRMLRSFRLIVAGSFAAAMVLAALAVYYILRKIRLPLLRLQGSVGRIAAGQLDTPIAIPQSGVIRELAQGVEAMTGQLRERLVQVTDDRNERELLFSAMTECVMLVDETGNLLRANRSARRFFGMEEEHFNINRCRIAPLVNLVHEAFENNRPFEQELEPGAPYEGHAIFVHGQFMERDDLRLLLLTITDLSALRQLETFRSDFLANVSHEIKTPLTCIVGAAEALEECSSPEEQRKLVAMMKRHSERLNRLVHDILDLTAIERLQRDSSHCEFAPVQLDALMAEVANLTGEQIREAAMELEFHGGSDLWVNGDFSLLEQAVINLVSNAVKYSNCKHIVLSAKREQDSTVISVSDDGVGIPVQCQNRLFERFYRVDKSRSRQLGGTGLGLAIVKHTAQLHGGSVEVESSPGKGATFRLILPLAPAPQQGGEAPCCAV